MLSDQIKDYVNAAFNGLWVQTHEPDEAEREIQQACAANDWKAFAWDITGQAHQYMPVLPNAADPVGTLIDGHLVARAEQPCGRQTRNAAADDGDLETHIVSHI